METKQTLREYLTRTLLNEDFGNWCAQSVPGKTMVTVAFAPKGDTEKVKTTAAFAELPPLFRTSFLRLSSPVKRSALPGAGSGCPTLSR